MREKEKEKRTIQLLLSGLSCYLVMTHSMDSYQIARHLTKLFINSLVQFKTYLYPCSSISRIGLFTYFSLKIICILKSSITQPHIDAKSNKTEMKYIKYARKKEIRQYLWFAQSMGYDQIKIH